MLCHVYKYIFKYSFAEKNNCLMGIYLFNNALTRLLSIRQSHTVLHHWALAV